MYYITYTTSSSSRSRACCGTLKPIFDEKMFAVVAITLLIELEKACHQQHLVLFTELLAFLETFYLTASSPATSSRMIAITLTSPCKK